VTRKGRKINRRFPRLQEAKIFLKRCPPLFYPEFPEVLFTVRKCVPEGKLLLRLKPGLYAVRLFNPATGRPFGITLFTNTTNSTVFPDRRGVQELWRLLTGQSDYRYLARTAIDLVRRKALAQVEKATQRGAARTSARPGRLDRNDDEWSSTRTGSIGTCCQDSSRCCAAAGEERPVRA
jgi:hypothetical protein